MIKHQIYFCISKVQSMMVTLSFCLSVQPNIDFNNQPFSTRPKCVHLDECALPSQWPENYEHSVGEYFIITGCEDEGRLPRCPGYHSIQSTDGLWILGKFVPLSGKVFPNVRQRRALDSWPLTLDSLHSHRALWVFPPLIAVHAFRI